MIFKKKKTKYDKKTPAIQTASNPGRRGFLKFLGIGSVAASSAMISKAIPVGAQTKLLIEEEIKKAPEKALLDVPKSGTAELIPHYMSDLPDILDKGITPYLIQEKTGRIYVYSDKLAQRSDMKLLAPHLSEKLHEDTLQVQELERQWEKGIESRLLRAHGSTPRRQIVEDTKPDFRVESTQKLPLKHKKGAPRWVRPDELVETDIMKKPV